jgi:hypothetical protein
VFDLEKLHELAEYMLMHLIPYIVPDGSILPQIFKTEYFFNLKLVQIFVDEGAFDHILLSFIFVLMVVMFDVLSFLIVVIVEVPYSMGVLAFFAAVDTEPS